LNLPVFIARRIKKPGSGTFSSMIHNYAIISVAVGLFVMIVAVLIMVGFKKTIRDKVAIFNGDLQITKYTMGSNFEELPVTGDSAFFEVLRKLPEVDHVQGVAHKIALIKTHDEIQGVVFKGIGQDFDFKRFNRDIVKGKFIEPADSTDSTASDEVVISRKISNQLNISTGDPILIYFIQEPVRVRKLVVAGIYDSGMEEFDDKIIFGDIKVIQQLNGWEPGSVGTWEVFIKDPSEILNVQKKLMDMTNYDLYVDSIRDKFDTIFDWLSLIDRNVLILLVLMLAVASFNMSSAIIILIMERTQMIGILKAIGASSRQIRRIFWHNGTRLIYYGLFWGNLLGLGFGFLQSRFRLIPLDPENYYMRYVPIQWDWISIAGLNLLVLIIVSLTIYLPTIMIQRINPIRAIRFD
jgi:lipoprotein-releasing system permease protein